MIYLDNAATAPMNRTVIEAMWPYLTEEFGNASSRHDLGRRASDALEGARAHIAGILGCAAREVVFTSGATESNNYAIKGLAYAAPSGRVIVSTPIEHEAVLEPIEFLKRHHDFSVRFVNVDSTGRVDLEHLESLLDAETTLCSVQYANSEVGTVQDINAIAEACQARGVLFHTDAVQAAGSMPLQTQADLLSLSAHKFGGPKGVGILMRRRSVALEPLLHGGGQEAGQRSGTSNVAGAVGMAVALELAEADRDAFTSRVKALRDELINGIDATLTGHPTHRLPQHASFTLGNISGESMVVELAVRGIAISSGSACAEDQDEPSYVLRALGIDDSVAQTAVRFTLGAATTQQEIETTLSNIAELQARSL